MRHDLEPSAKAAGQSSILLVAWLTAAVLFIAFYGWLLATPERPQERLASASEASPAPAPPTKPDVAATPIPPFDADHAKYVLLSWNNLGMHCISDSDPWWVLLPPANDLFAQLVRRGPSPEVVTDNVRITYQVEQGFENPSSHSRFWEFSTALFGKELPKNVGLSGNGVSGEMKLHAEHNAFVADLIPVMPYKDDGSFNPYPIFRIEARDATTGELLAETSTVAPTSTEMGCKNCHGGDWKVAGVAGFTDQTSMSVLAAHDKLSGTTLLAEAKAGKPKLCQSCHADPVLGTKGDGKTLGFPAALHGFHAAFLPGQGAQACFMCHPSNPAGVTKCQRDLHLAKGLDCVRCHGFLEDHALGLLKHEKDQGKARAELLMSRLKPRMVASVEDIPARQPWLMEPDCQSCHDFQTKPDRRTANAFGKWTSGKAEDLYRMRKEDGQGLMCESCHGSTHALYPALNPIERNRDNIQPLQYQGVAKTIGGGGNCAVCHEVDMTDSIHHPIVTRATLTVSVPAGAELKRPLVAFPHSSHRDLDCGTCHHKGYQEKGRQGCVSPGCHDLASPADAQERSSPRYFRNAFHGKGMASCNNCHQDLKKAGEPAGPVECKECHQAKAAS